MHEYGLCDGVVEAVCNRAAGRKVLRVKVRVGVMHRVVPDIFAHAFEHSAEGTEAEGAEVDIVVLPVSVKCQACQKDSESLEAIAVCPACGSVNLDRHGGDELVLESIELEVPQTSALAAE